MRDSSQNRATMHRFDIPAPVVPVKKAPRVPSPQPFDTTVGFQLKRYGHEIKKLVRVDQKEGEGLSVDLARLRSELAILDEIDDALDLLHEHIDAVTDADDDLLPALREQCKGLLLLRRTTTQICIALAERAKLRADSCANRDERLTEIESILRSLRLAKNL
jgi:hypothetical protein